MIKTALLEVTEIEPRYKHSTIFEHFDALVAGESFIIRNDHDPKPLYYQLIGERGNIFTWDYLESGPEYWQVRIGKTSQVEDNETIGTIAAKDLRKAALLKQLGVDFCCGGKQTIKEAATSIGISEDDLKERLEDNSSVMQASINLNFAARDTDFLSDYIKNVHHKYVKDKGPLIQQLADKVATIHRHQHPELADLAAEVNLLMDDLYRHLDIEETHLFPSTKSLKVLTKEQNQHIINQLSKEHESAGHTLKQVRKITHEYQLPADACHSYTYLFDQLQDFEADLLQHIHLENNILFPKMIKAHEQSLN